MKRLLCLMPMLLLAACQAPLAHLSFPEQPLRTSREPQRFDVNHDGRDDFAVTFDSNGRADSLCYDDNQDGHWDRIYHLRDYDHARLPHLILLLDSIPFSCAADRYAAGDFR